MAKPHPSAPGPARNANAKRRSRGRQRNPYFAQLNQFIADVAQRGALPDLSPEQVLAWADAHYARFGAWPTCESGEVHSSDGEDWLGIEAALMLGGRGFPGKDTLCRLLHRHRGKRNHRALPPLRVEEILLWADAWHDRTGAWPRHQSGAVADGVSQTWRGVNMALQEGLRGMPGGSSLARLLAHHRSARNHLALPPLRVEEILNWADAWHDRAGSWPRKASGAVGVGVSETWLGVEQALRAGRRGLPGGSSLARLLAQHRGVRNKKALPPLRVEEILRWADAWYSRTGRWPRSKSGTVAKGVSETWLAVDSALHEGLRGLPGGSSLIRLLAQHRKVDRDQKRAGPPSR